MKETVGVVNMTDANGSEVTGALLIKTNGPDLVIIAGKIWNLPVGEHPIHIHEYGSIGNNCMDAGGHFNPQPVSKVIFLIHN